MEKFRLFVPFVPTKPTTPRPNSRAMGRVLSRLYYFENGNENENITENITET